MIVFVYHVRTFKGIISRIKRKTKVWLTCLILNDALMRWHAGGKVISSSIRCLVQFDRARNRDILNRFIIYVFVSSVRQNAYVVKKYHHIYI